MPVSTVKVDVSVAVMPPAPIAVATAVCGPSASGVVGVTVHVPSAATVAVPTLVPSTVTVMVSPGVPCPVIGTVPLATVAPSAGASIVTNVPAITVNVLVAIAVLPAGSVAVATAVCGPFESAALVGTDQVPSAATVAEPTAVPSTVTWTVAPGSPVPVMVGVALITVDPFAGAVIATIVVSSTVKLFIALAVLPAPSRALAATAWGPAASGVVVGIDQVPSAATVTVPIGVPSITTFTIAPGSPVPVIVGRGPVVLPFAGEVIATIVALSSVKVLVAFETPPTVSVARAATTCIPAATPAGAGSVQRPIASAVAVPTGAPSIVTTTVAPASAVPAIGGTIAIVVPLPGAVMATSRRQSLLQPSPGVVFVSSQVSGGVIVPLPQTGETVTTVGWLPGIVASPSELPVKVVMLPSVSPT